MRKQLHPSFLDSSFEIANCYDSHVHYFASGETAYVPSLRSLTSAEDLQQMHFPKERQKNGWVYGFGWDERHWKNLTFLNRSFLDQIFPHEPVFFSRVDGHSSWCNTRGLEKLGLIQSVRGDLTNQAQQLNAKHMMVEVDSQGLATGILRESAHIHGLQHLGDWSDEQKKSMYQFANALFLRQGYTHVRDMTSTMEQYHFLKSLEDEHQLLMNLDLNFVVENADHFRQVCAEMKKITKDSSRQIRLRGVKFFYDGSMGSQTALLSEKHPNGGHGVALWDLKDLEQLMTEAFQNHLEVSVHTLGDEAVDQVVSLTQKISQRGIFGRLNLEHLELCRLETIQKMKSLHIRCHQQPSHWLSDKNWLLEKLGTLRNDFFQWEALRAAKVDLRFGSDSPIEAPSVYQVINGIVDFAETGLSTFRGDFKLHCQSPYLDQVSGKSHFRDGQVTEVWFDGKRCDPLFNIES